MFQDVGCFSKGAHLPLVVTKPFSAALREKLCKTHRLNLVLDETYETKRDDMKSSIWSLQRGFRSELVNEHFDQSATVHAPVSHGQGNYLSELLPFRSFYRTKKQSRREMKSVEKEERRRRAEIDDRRRKKSAEYVKAVMLHRDDFFRFHKNKRSGEHISQDKISSFILFEQIAARLLVL